MSVLSDIDLKNILKENDGIIIMNKREESVTGVGYDLMIGFIRDADTGKEPETCKDDENRYTLLPGHRYLVISKEFLYLSSQYIATIHSRGSYALKGIIVPSTTVDPNYIGCITGCLYINSKENINIKKNNSFGTMVIHRLCTPTETTLQKNEHDRPKDAQETLHSKYPNIHKQACTEADAYYGQIRKKYEYEFEKAMNNWREKKISKNINPKTKKITFLIGNGFDLKMGLKTRYQDFYAYYVENNPDDLLAKEIQRNIVDWSDLELAIGNVTEKIAPAEVENFWKSEKNLEGSLVSYLKDQMKKVNLDEEKIQRDMGYEVEKTLKDFYNKFPVDIKTHISTILQNNLIDYSFITFNYTNVLDKCLNAVTARCSIHISSEYGKAPLHIHGIVGSSMVLGVDNETQIKNMSFRTNPNDSQLLIKKDIIDKAGNKEIYKAKMIIDNSDIVCIYGMSIGATDQMWWKYISKWLKEDKNRILIIFAHDNESYAVGKFTNDCKNKMCEKFKNNGELDGEWDLIKKQVHVEVNADIFNFNVI